MSEPFFSRWSRRKQGLDRQEPEAIQPVAAQADARQLLQADQGLAAPQSAASHTPHNPTEGPAEPTPTLEDVERLTPASDFQTYMRQGVPGEVRNAAMKKLFTDPHFNVMDGLDIYIGDYNTPDPMPAGMLQKMVGAELLNLFPKTQENPDHSAPASDSAAFVAKSPDPQAASALQADTTAPHDHPDLQLQPNHAPARPDSGSSTG